MNDRAGDHDDHEIVNFNSGDNSSEATFARPPLQITPNELRAALNVVVPEVADDLYGALVDEIGRPGVTWSIDILWAMAQASDDRARRVTEHLGWSREKLEAEYRRIYPDVGF